MCHFWRPHRQVFGPHWAMIPEQGQWSRQQAMGTAQQGTPGSCSREHTAPTRPMWTHARCTAYAARYRHAKPTVGSWGEWAASGEALSAGRGVRELCPLPWARSPRRAGRGTTQHPPAFTLLPQGLSVERQRQESRRRRRKIQRSPFSTATISSNICRQHFQNASKKNIWGEKEAPRLEGYHGNGSKYRLQR